MATTHRNPANGFVVRYTDRRDGISRALMHPGSECAYKKRETAEQAAERMRSYDFVDPTSVQVLPADQPK